MDYEQPISEAPVQAPVMEPVAEPGNTDEKKKKTGLIIGIVIACIVLVVGGFVALFLIEKAKAEERERKAAAVIVDNQTEIGKKKVSKKKKDDNTTVEEEEEEEEKDEDVADAKKYLEVPGWAVKFSYPEGVTDVKYEVQDVNFDGELFIMGIVTADKIYDINICGGKVMYEQYPFMLGRIARWNPNATHEEWNTSPISVGMSLTLKEGGIEYFSDDENGNGCASNEASPDYAEAVRLTKLLLGSIEKK